MFTKSDHLITLSEKTQSGLNTQSLKKHKNVINDMEAGKYALPLHLKLKHKDIMQCATGNPTFENWKSQNVDKFGFVPLANHTIPHVDKNNTVKGGMFEIHNILQKSNLPNFLGEQIRIKSELNIENWEKYLHDYWDKQLIYLLKYGFPLNFNTENPLQSTEKNCFSATKFKTHVDEYLREEIEHWAILGPFDEKPLHNLHISPFLSGEKPDSSNRRIIVDLSFAHAFSVNANISKDVYLDSPFLLTLPTVNHIYPM